MISLSIDCGSGEVLYIVGKEAVNEEMSDAAMGKAR